VLTVDAADSVAEAIAVRDGRIIAIGRDEVVSRLAGPQTRVIDLAGKTVTPGLRSWPGPNLCEEWQAFAGKMECGCVGTASAIDLPMR
jgi:hypothetical protein